ncbi:transporter [Azotobacter vinelandii]
MVRLIQIKELETWFSVSAWVMITHQKLHAAYVIDITAPTGRYDSDKLANVGRNYWVAQPLAAITYAQPEGFNGDMKIMYNFNFENSETDYKSGQELLVDYDFGWGFAKRWVVGAGGYAYWQTTDDHIHGKKST